MVFLNTKFHCTSQFKEMIVLRMGIGLSKQPILPPLFVICVSVILCKVINTGAKLVFIITLIKKAPNNFIAVKSPDIATNMPLKTVNLSINAGTPLRNTPMAAAIHIPRKPQMTARGNNPKPGALYFPVLIRKPKTSPKVASMANFRNAIDMGLDRFQSL